MALRKIVEQGDECLTKVCRPVEKFDRRLHDLLDDMAETLADANGAGLAAPQVGILRRVCLVLDEESEEYLELINPEIIAQSGAEIQVEIDPAKLRPVEIPVIRADLSKLQQDTGWTPEIPLEQTIAETLDVWKQQLQK